MRNVVIPIGDGYSLSLFQSEVTGAVEVVPIWEGEDQDDDLAGGLIGEPVFVKDGVDLMELFQQALDRKFDVWLNQYIVELDEEIEQGNFNIKLVVDND